MLSSGMFVQDFEIDIPRSRTSTDFRRAGWPTTELTLRFTCPNQRTFYAAAVFWGTISPNRLFGKGARYNWMLAGFPLGVGLVVAYWFLRRRFPRSEFLRQCHPVMLTVGPSTWGSPYNMSYFLGNVYTVLFSFQ